MYSIYYKSDDTPHHILHFHACLHISVNLCTYFPFTYQHIKKPSKQQYLRRDGLSIIIKHGSARLRHGYIDDCGDVPRQRVINDDMLLQSLINICYRANRWAVYFLFDFYMRRHALAKVFSSVNYYKNFFFKVEALQKYQIIETFCRVALAKGAGTHEVVGQQKESS